MTSRSECSARTRCVSGLRAIVWALLLACGPVLAAGGSQGAVRVPATIVVQPTATRTWSQMIEQDAGVRAARLSMVGVVEAAPGGGIAPAPVARIAAVPEPTSGAGQIAVDGAAAPEGVACPPSSAAFSLDDTFLGLGDPNFRIPPDTMGAVGPDHVMTMLNTEVRIQSRSGAVQSTVSIFTFWASVATSPFDPRLQFDSGSNRWIAVVDAESRSANSKVCVAISQTANPLGTWTFYQIDADATNEFWADFPNLGINGRWVTITNNMFGVSNNSYGGPKMWVISKPTLLAGGPLTLSVFETGFDNTGFSSGFTMVPTTGDVSNEMFILDNFWFNNASFVPQVRLSRLAGTAAAPVWQEVINPASADPFFDVPIPFSFSVFEARQAGELRTIATNDARLQNAVINNGLITFTHHASPDDGDNRVNVYWSALNTLNLAAPFSNFGVVNPGPLGAAFFPSVAVNCEGDMALGFSLSDPSRFVSAAYTTRQSTDPAGFTAPISVSKAGLSRYYRTGSGTRNRWGDYSATVVDPADLSSFWTIQQYAEQRVGPNDGDSRWATQWTRIAIATPCPADFTADGFVDDSDFVIFAAAYEAFTVPPADAVADLTGDGFVDDADFVLFAAAYEAFACP